MGRAGADTAAPDARVRVHELRSPLPHRRLRTAFRLPGLPVAGVALAGLPIVPSPGRKSANARRLALHTLRRRARRRRPHRGEDSLDPALILWEDAIRSPEKFQPVRKNAANSLMWYRPLLSFSPLALS